QLCLISTALGQGAADFTSTALQFSMTNPGGSARTIGLGGTATALGGDITAASSNPAGLGFFNRSEFSFSTQFNALNSSSLYLGSRTDESKLNFNIPNLGAVIHKGSNRGKWRGGSFGFSVNRVVDFHNTARYEGLNTESDFIRYSIFQDNVIGPNDLTDLAFNTFLTDEFFQIYDGGETVFIDGVEVNVADFFGNNLQAGDSLFFVDRNIFDAVSGEPATPGEDFPVIQDEIIETRGAIYKASFSYGANYNDQLYLGASLGLLSVNKEVERTYTERPTEADLDNLILTDIFDITGGGVVGTFGVIARPVTPLLIGLSYTTPTYYFLEQTRELSLTANYIGFSPETDGILFTPFDYSITTPSSLKAGLTGFFGKNGFITAEVERINYGGANLSRPSDGVSFTEFNNTIDRSFESTFNYRVGAEYRFDIFRLRAGYSYIDDPVEDELDQSITEVSFGGGVRTNKFYFDIGVATGSLADNSVSPYPDTPIGSTGNIAAPTASITNDNTRVSLTFGILF
ncbi:MAG: hypothetical protein AAFN93_09515, partial [Bacteroidota bacterium]